MSVTDAPFLNGVNVAALLGAKEALSEAPEAAEFQWRATCTWVNGTHSHSTVSGFSGLGVRDTTTPLPCRKAIVARSSPIATGPIERPGTIAPSPLAVAGPATARAASPAAPTRSRR